MKGSKVGKDLIPVLDSRGMVGTVFMVDGGHLAYRADRMKFVGRYDSVAQAAGAILQEGGYSVTNDH